MPLMTSNEMLTRAMKESYGVAAFNANCLEMIPALIKAVEEERAPLILQIGKKYLDYMPPHMIASIALELASKAAVPVCLHLDHGNGIKMVEDCFDAGFTSLMYDGSHLSLEENIANTKKVVELARKKGVPVEGEVGKVLLAEDVKDLAKLDDLTEPQDAERFVAETGVQSVAVSIGNVHRMLKKEAKLDFERIRAIKKVVDVPLVMHGSSGISDEDIQKAVKEGIVKVNIATEFNAVFVKGVKEKMQKQPCEIFPMELLRDGMEAVTKMARERIRMLGCNNKY